MTTVYTKNGAPLSRRGDDLFDQSGRHVARLRGDKAFGLSGEYVGTMVSGRLVYRSTDSSQIGPSIAPRAGAGSAAAPRADSALAGDEPTFDHRAPTPATPATREVVSIIASCSGLPRGLTTRRSSGQGSPPNSWFMACAGTGVGQSGGHHDCATSAPSPR